VVIVLRKALGTVGVLLMVVSFVSAQRIATELGNTSNVFEGVVG